MTTQSPLPLTLSPEVAEARARGQAIVALESTIITHGMPFPQNVEAARAVEAEVRAHGAVPATIAVMGGQILIGLSDAQLDTLGQTPDAMKLSRADLPVCVALGRVGATTVAATMICAAMAGIHVFATGGIGGVHRGAETTFDVSADLIELGLSPVTVVAAGAKAILDLPKTLEVLETQGVPVITVGQDELPAFWSRSSGLKSPLRMDDPAQIASAHLMRGVLGLGTWTSTSLSAALAEAEAQGIAAKEVTPFLLDRMFAMTEGRSLTANIALVLNNARLGAAIAVEIARLRG